MNLIKKGDKNLTVKKHNKSDLIYNNELIFNKYYNIKEFETLSFKSKCLFLVGFFNEFNKFSKLKTQKDKTEKEKSKYVP